jgi:hypothetical protein
MSIQRLLIAFAAVFAASTSAGYAGPCSQDIARLQAAMDAKLRAVTAAGPRAPESSAATMYRQPTPRSIATAESELGGLSPDQVKAAVSAMARAREADSANDESACKQAKPMRNASLVSSYPAATFARADGWRAPPAAKKVALHACERRPAALPIRPNWQSLSAL